MTYFLVHPNGCGLTDDVTQWMDRVQSGNSDEEYVEKPQLQKNQHNNTTKHHPNNHNNTNRHHHNFEHENCNHQKYSKEANSRPKRATRFQERNTCSLYIQTDPLIWRHIRESIPDVSCHV